MADSSILATCPEDQCQSIDERGNFCRLKKTPGMDYCPKHGGVLKQRQLMHNYRLTRYKANIEDKVGQDSILSLREEIGIARLTLEEIINQTNSAVDLIMYQPKIVQLVQTIQKTVESCQRVEEKTNNLLSKTTLLQFADELITIITEHVTDHNVRALIADQIMLKLQRISDPTQQ